MTSHGPTGPSKWHREYENPAKGMVYLRELVPSTTVYRYMHQGQLEDLLSTSKLKLRPPHGWDDPHEEWWCKELFQDGSALQDAQPYASCWTVRNMDEPFWRFYSCRCKPDSPPPPPAVRIRTTVGKLVEVLSRAVDATPAKVFIGRVRYCASEVLEQAAKRMREGYKKEVASEAANGLHMKRNAFRFEQEVRVLWIEDDRPPREDTKVPIDPLLLIDQVMIGPAKDRDKVAKARAMVIKLGIPGDVIDESTIYKTPGAFAR
jgi:hypothetical protein